MQAADALMGRGIEESVAARTTRQILWRRFRSDRAALAGLAVIALPIVLAIAAPLIVAIGNHHPPNTLYTHEALDQNFGTPIGPNGHFWFGADPSGRDLFSRVIYGARASLLVAVVSTAFS